jgi:peroxiredoxin Q/BCP
MSQLRQDYPEFLNRDAEVVVIGPEGSDSFRKYWSENSLPFNGLPDPRHKVLKLYGQQIRIFKFGRMPAQAIIDKSGIIRYLHYGQSMSDIPTNTDLLKLIDEINYEVENSVN